MDEPSLRIQRDAAGLIPDRQIQDGCEQKHSAKRVLRSLRWRLPIPGSVGHFCGAIESDGEIDARGKRSFR